MADTLRFRKGKAAGLESLAKSGGTIYITTDEHAMYVDINDEERIRLGDFIVVPSLNDLATSAYRPWSTTALYYVTAENALARYDGKDWKQINDTSEIETNIRQLIAAIGTKKTETAEATGIYLDIDILNNKIEALTGGEGGDIPSIEGLTARLIGAEMEINSLQTTVEHAETGLVKRVSDLVDRVDDINDSVTSNTTAIIKLNGNNEIAGSVDYKIYQATKDLATQQSVTDIKTTVDKLDGSVTTEGSIKKQIADAVGDKATQQSVADLNNTVISQGTAITNLHNQMNGNADTAGTVASKIKAALDAEKAEDGSIGKLEDRVDTAEENITTLQNKIGSADISDAGDSITEAISNINSQVSTDAGSITSLQTKVNSIDTRLETAEGAIARLDGDETTVNSVEYKIAQKLQAADAMTFKGVITNELPVTGVKIGDTYKIGKASFFGGHSCKVGDLLIANIAAGKTEVNGTIPNDDLVWEYVPSGGEDDTDPVLSVANNVISLTNILNAPLGSVTFVGSAIDAAGGISVDTSNSKIIIDMVWGSF